MTVKNNFPTGEQVELYDLTVTYGADTILDRVSGIFRPGTSTAIVGPNGAGKSTLLKTIMGYIRPQSGRITIGNRKTIAYLPQRHEIDRSFPLTVRDAVAMGLWRRVGLWKGMGAYQGAIENALQEAGIQHLGNRLLDTLSGGQFQRVLFARLILQDSHLILLDEPFVGMDTQTVHDLSALIQRWHGQGKTILTVLHDMDIVKTYFPETVMLARGVVAWGATETVLHKDMVRLALDRSRTWDALFVRPDDAELLNV